MSAYFQTGQEGGRDSSSQSRLVYKFIHGNGSESYIIKQQSAAFVKTFAFALPLCRCFRPVRRADSKFPNLLKNVVYAGNEFCPLFDQLMTTLRHRIFY